LMGRSAACPEEGEGAPRAAPGSSLPKSLARLSSYLRRNSVDETSRTVATH